MPRTKLTSRELPGDYAALVREHPPHHLADGVAYRNAIELMDRLAAIASPSRGHLQYMAMLADLIHVYELEHQSLDDAPIAPTEALAFMMEQHAMKPADLARVLDCDRSLASRIVSGQRNLTIDHIRTLSEHFGVDPGYFIQDPPRRRRGR